MQLEPYLFFEGRCDEAIDFYRRAIGAQVEAAMRYNEAPAGMPCPAEVRPDSVMHARLRVGDTHFMASDGRCEGKPRFEGFALSVTAPGDAEAKRLFDALADAGSVQMPLAPTFFATSFGMLTDRFGVAWMVYAPRPEVKARERQSATTA
ncbi:MAG: VOC family protein [Betaproteobacteria bacterium]